jgi:hypothetical protein
MDLRLTHERLVSFAASAMITASFFATAPGVAVTAASGPQPAAILGALEGLRASGWQGLKESYEPTVPASPRPTAASFTPAEKMPLSDTEIQKLSKLLAEHGADAPLSSAVTTALGLTRPGESLTLRQLHVYFDNKTRAHAYHLLPNDGGYLILAVSPTDARSYRANIKQELIAAVDTFTGQAPVVIPVADAQKELAAEFAYWAGIADKF